MKFIKSNLAKYIIIILIAIMIFNIAVPHTVHAGIGSKIADIAGGILLKPLFALISLFLISVDITLGVVLTGASSAVDAISGFVAAVHGLSKSAVYDINNALCKLFIGPDTIFAGHVAMLNANIFRGTTVVGDGNIEIGDWLGDITGYNSLTGSATALQPGAGIVATARQSVARIYVILRNICGFIMLGGLIFTGIRILLSSNIPTKKTQYLMLLQDWLIGMVLLIFSHLIMIGVFWISDTITASLSMGLNNFGGINFNIAVNLVNSWSATEQIILSIMLGYLIWLTVIFAFAYFKRFLWTCVLTVFAPVFAIMYAFGQQTKQIYSKWIREYMMNVFVQPFHMVVYSVLVMIPMNAVGSFGSAGSTSIAALIYALLAISFIRPAEKYMRNLFGFDKGVAAMASFDSGKQTFDAMKSALKSFTNKLQLGGGINSLMGGGKQLGGGINSLMGGGKQLGGGNQRKWAAVQVRRN